LCERVVVVAMASSSVGSGPPEEGPGVGVGVGVGRAQAGQVVVFSVSACVHCRAAKALLRSRGLRVDEVNLDVFPERRDEARTRSGGGATMPQVFFNGAHVGGNDDLQALASREGALDAALEDAGVWASAPEPGMEIPVAAPTADATGASAAAAADAGAGAAEDEGVVLAEALRASGMPRGDRGGWCTLSWMFGGPATAGDTFARADAVAWLESLGEADGAAALRRLEDGCLVVAVAGPDVLRFPRDDRGLSGCLNFDKAELPPGLAPNEAERPGEVAARLRRSMLAVYEDHLSEDGRVVDYAGMARSEAFRRYERSARVLQRVDLARLGRDERVAFCVNLYNALMVHATVDRARRGVPMPGSTWERINFFGTTAYAVGGRRFALDDLEHGVLRANRRSPAALFSRFPAGDPRLAACLDAPEPRVHFALVCGARGCPPIKTYRTDHLDADLDAAARGFLEGGGLEFGPGVNDVRLSSILKWYRGDFGATDDEVLDYIAPYLGDAARDRLAAIRAAGSLALGYLDYDWTSNGAPPA